MAYRNPQPSPERVHGAIRDSHDPHYDGEIRLHSRRQVRAAKSRPVVDLRENVAQVYDQGNMGSCSANAMCSAFTLDYEFEPSRLFLYYNSRLIEGDEEEDDGVHSIRDCIKAFNEYGICEEYLWPYSEGRLFKEPSRRAYSTARKPGYMKGRVRGKRLLEHDDDLEDQRRYQGDIHQLKACLHGGSPFIFGFEVYKNFEDWDGISGHSIMPRPRGKHSGGHAVMAVGYNNNYHGRSCIIVLNSWGSDWGDNGYFYMPYGIIVDPSYCFDFWKVDFD